MTLRSSLWAKGRGVEKEVGDAEGVDVKDKKIKVSYEKYAVVRYLADMFLSILFGSDGVSGPLDERAACGTHPLEVENEDAVD